MESKWPVPSLHSSPKMVGGRYYLISSLGAGVLGKVFYGEDSWQNPPEPVAVKVLHPDLIDNQEMLNELQNEADTLSLFDHPNIIRLLAAKVTSEEAYLVTEYASGGTLAQLIYPDPDLPSQPVSLTLAVDYLRQLTEALSLIHLENVVHRDLKLENILLSSDGVLKLVDFSLAVKIDSWSPNHLVDFKDAWGTPYYAAPEVWDGKVSKVTDIYALGVIFYQLLTGHPPFQGSPEELKEQHIYAPVPSLKVHAPDLDYPPELDKVIAAALSKQPETRISTPDQFYLQVSKALRSSPDHVSALTPVTTVLAQKKRTGPVIITSSISQKLANTGLNSSTPNVPSNPQPNPASNFSWQTSSLKSVGVSSNTSFKSTRSSSSYSAGCTSVFMMVLIPVAVLIIILASSGSKGKSNRTYNNYYTPTPASYSQYATRATDGSVVIRWHEGTVTSLVPDVYGATAYGNLGLNYIDSIESSGKAAGWLPDGKGPYKLLKDQYGIFTRVYAAAISSQGKRAVAGDSNEIFFIDYLTDASDKTGIFVSGHTAKINSLSWSPDGKILASASDDNTVRLWASTGTALATLTGHTGRVLSVAWSFDGKILASASADKTIKLWDTSGNLLTTITGHTLQVNSVSWQNYTNVLASASDDGTIRMWDAKGQPIRVLDRHKAAVSSVAWSPDGRRLASGSADKTILVWDGSGQLLNTLEGHTGAVSSLAWTIDGKTLASGSADRTVRFWNMVGR